MENLNKCRLNYSLSNNRNYTAYQMILPLDLSKKIEEDDPVRSFLEVMEGVNWSKYLKTQSKKGREEYNPFKMIKIVLFAFMNQIYTLRGIEKACKTDIRFMYLMGEEKPSHMAIQRFITKYLKDSIENIFGDIFESICLLDDINKDVVYVDGTKIEANANKFTFIWKKTAIKTRDKTFIRINNLVERIKDFIKIDKKEQWSPEEVEDIRNQLKMIMEKEKVVFVYGKGRRKSEIQRIYDDFKKLKDTLESCLERINLCGPNRNSCSKTDSDATMMHMKEDYYMRTGIFKAGYNGQIAVSDEYIQYGSIYQERNDQKTLISFMDEFKELYKRHPKVIVADAGYGSYDNYFYCAQNNIEAYIKYTMYNKEKEKKYQNNRFNKNNWETNENGQLICPAKNEFYFVKECEDKRSKYPRINQYYSCDKCVDCQLKSQCTKSKYNRTIVINPILKEFEETARNKLDSELGIFYRINRSIQAEGAYGVIKENFGYDRFNRRKHENVKLEFLLVCIGYNLSKYHNKKYRILPQA